MLKTQAHLPINGWMAPLSGTPFTLIFSALAGGLMAPFRKLGSLRRGRR